MTRRHLRSSAGSRRVGQWIASGLLALLALVMWPHRFGGSTSLVVVQGGSMEPTYHSGDLLFVRATDDLEIGDIAVYTLPDGPGAGRHIVHRIVGRTPDGRFEFRGDAKPLLDDVRPRESEIVGRPIANLGPLPLRLLVAIPYVALLAIVLSVGWLLWPPAPTRAAPSEADDGTTTDEPRSCETTAPDTREDCTDGPPHRVLEAAGAPGREQLTPSRRWPSP